MKSSVQGTQATQPSKSGIVSPLGGKENFFSKNQSSQSFFPRIQTKISMGQPGDKYEVEADAMADKIVQSFGKHPPKLLPFFNKPLSQNYLQRRCKSCGEIKQFTGSGSSEPVQQKCTNCQKEEHLQKRQTPGPAPSNSQQVGSNIEERIRSMQGSGQNMDAGIRQMMEAGFGADFGNIRIHNNPAAASLSEQLNAQAFTFGRDIFFNQGRYNPNSELGVGLLAHELVHTIQQGAAHQRGQNANAFNLEEINQLLQANDISFSSLEEVNELQRKSQFKQRSGLKIQRCPPGDDTRVTVRYHQYGATGFEGSCPAYCACEDTPGGNDRISIDKADYGGECPPGIEIVWRGNTRVSETALDHAPCGSGNDRGCR